MADSPNSVRHHGRKLKRFALLAVLVLCALFHRPLLQALAWPLIADDPCTDCGYLLVLGGDRRFDVAAQMVSHGRARRVLLFEDSACNLVILGIVPPGHQVASRELVERGIPPEAITVIDREERAETRAFDELNDWMEQHDETNVCLLTGRFRSRLTRRRLDLTLNAGNAQRVSVVGLPDRRYNETDWWKSRLGIKSFVYAWLSLIHSWCVGETTTPRERWDPVAYERELRGESG